MKKVSNTDKVDLDGLSKREFVNDAYICKTRQKENNVKKKDAE